MDHSADAARGAGLEQGARRLEMHRLEAAPAVLAHS
jgi:hypothetical protein